jgi:hypothetical protein
LKQFVSVSPELREKYHLTAFFMRTVFFSFYFTYELSLLALIEGELSIQVSFSSSFSSSSSDSDELLFSISSPSAS